MVYIVSWDEFVDRSVQLFRADPKSTRYVIKYRHCDGKLVLKVTDNKQLIFLKSMERTDGDTASKERNRKEAINSHQTLFLFFPFLVSRF
ncbi:hypothetical protein Bca4012_025997 [Brassica carinata]